jgi:hypothetical protein
MAKALLPREHGAYAQLGFPLLTGLILARGAPGAVAFTGAAIAAFLAHEPMAIIMGVRGVRLRDALVGSARRRLWLLGGLGVLALMAAIFLAPGRAWRAALVPAVPGLVLVPLFLTNRVKTVAGEFVAATAFSAALLPVALSGRATGPDAWVAAAVWLGAVLPAIVSVHAVKAAHKRRPRGHWLMVAAPAVALLAGLVALGAAQWLPHPASRALAVLPPVLAVLLISILRPHPRHLKRIGWTMVGANVATLVLLLAL